MSVIDFPHVWVPPKQDVNNLSGQLAYMALLGKLMPPAFEGAGISQPIFSPEGHFLGKNLPGKGIYLNYDLKDLGITKRIPFIYERTHTNRLIDSWHKRKKSDRMRQMLWNNNIKHRSDWTDRMFSEVGAITTYDGIINARAGGNAQDIAFAKTAPAVAVVGAWSS